MGSAMPFDSDEPFEEQVKCIPEDELLAMWEESQHVENMINTRLPWEFTVDPGFERAIVRELFLRASRKLLFPGGISQ